MNKEPEDGPTSWSRPKLRWKDVVSNGLHKKCVSLSLVSGINANQTSETADLTPTNSEWNKKMNRPVVSTKLMYT